MVAIYAVLFLTRLKEPVLAILWKNLILIVGVLALINLFTIVPAELKRWKNNTTTSTLSVYAQKEVQIDKNFPDIYYIVLDEFAGFQAMRDYWQYEEVDEFVSFLKDKGFFVAEESHGSSKETLYELASRLNYQNYTLDTHRQILFNDIASNRAMRYLKSRGYTTVVFDETKLPHAASKTIEADHVYEFTWDTHSSIPETTSKGAGFYRMILARSS